MEKDIYLLSYLDTTIENKIYAANDFAPDIIGHNDTPCRHGLFVNMWTEKCWTGKSLRAMKRCDTTSVQEMPTGEQIEVAAWY